MKSKLEKLRRIERLQKRMHELSRWKLTRMTNEQERLDQARAEMIAALGEGLLSFGGAASAATRRIRALEIEISAEAARMAQARHALEQGLRSRAAERAVQTTSAERETELRKRSLAELIEQSIQSSSASRKP